MTHSENVLDDADDGHEQEVGQLADELQVRAVDWGLLGTDVQVMLSQRGEDNADSLVRQLRAPGERECTAADLLRLLNEPGADDPTWWTTPLGRLIAHALDAPPGITHNQAANILNVTRGTIAQWVARGTLDRLPNGHINIQSVLTRFARTRSFPR